jgi:hypothetical protein
LNHKRKAGILFLLITYVHSNLPQNSIHSHINSVHTLPHSLRPILIISCHQCLDLPCDLFSEVSMTKILYAFTRDILETEFQGSVNGRSVGMNVMKLHYSLKKSTTSELNIIQATQYLVKVSKLMLLMNVL